MADPTVKLLESDHSKWIFPLRTPLVFAAADPNMLRAHIRKILDAGQPEAFVPGHIAYSRKDPHHLRRVQVLDPIATFFLYDFVQTHRDAFPRPTLDGRDVFGHFFESKKFVSGFSEYHRFRRRKYELIANYGHFAQVDVFNCFNSFYHHDVTSFVAERVSLPAGEEIGQFLRELNLGVSIACFPQGLYPAKVLGSAYLSLVETSRKLKAPGLARFLDDIVLAAKTSREVDDCILELQYLLDKHHLSLNDSKTTVGEEGQRFQERKLDRIKRQLLEKREAVKPGYDSDADEDDENDDEGLTDSERSYLVDLISEHNVAQEDIELALGLMGDDEEGFNLLTHLVLDSAPHLLRDFHRFVSDYTGSEDVLWNSINDTLSAERILPEHDLFWIARILISQFQFDQSVADALLEIYQRANGSAVVRAAILETEYLDHGFADLKIEAIRSEGTLLLAAAGMVGLASFNKAKRNQIFKYVARNSPHLAMLVQVAGTLRG